MPIPKKDRKQVKVEYHVIKDPVCSSDWNFFDARKAGLSLLATERHPVILEKSLSKESMVSKVISQSEKQNSKQNEQQLEKYNRCASCYRYVNSEVGPGLTEERKIIEEMQKEVKKESFPDVVEYKSISRASIHQPTVTPNETTFWDVLNDVQKMTNTSLIKQDVNVLPDIKSSRHYHYPVATRIRYNRRIHGKLDEKFQDDYFINKYALLFHRAAQIFIYFNGITPKLKMSATAFRNMARKCALCDHGSLPSLDILYMDVVRQCQTFKSHRASPFYNNPTGKLSKPSQSAGLPFQGFIDALLKIAGQRYRGDKLCEKLEILIENCESYIQCYKKMKKKNMNVDITMTLAQKNYPGKAKTNKTKEHNNTSTASKYFGPGKTFPLHYNDFQ